MGARPQARLEHSIPQALLAVTGPPSAGRGGGVPVAHEIIACAHNQYMQDCESPDVSMSNTYTENKKLQISAEKQPECGYCRAKGQGDIKKKYNEHKQEWLCTDDIQA